MKKKKQIYKKNKFIKKLTSQAIFQCLIEILIE